ncbi:MAG: hypothetical protein OEZ38_03980 [Gammaproteobacteria bacterium]|nr:hypothetical protein [Gammaproteobacteria bacterium]
MHRHQIIIFSLFFFYFNIAYGQENTFSKNHIQLEAADIDVDINGSGAILEGEGFHLKAGIELSPEFYLLIKHLDGELEDSIDFTHTEAGLGYIIQKNDDKSIFVEFYVGSIDMAGTIDLDTYSIKFIDQEKLNKYFHVEGYISFTDYEKKSDFHIGGTARYMITKNANIFLNADFGDIVEVLSVGTKINF